MMKAPAPSNTPILNRFLHWITSAINRKWLLLFAISIFVLGTGYALYQPVHPDPWHEHSAWDNFIYPLEQNADQRLPSVSQKLRDLAVIDKQIWVVGDGGLILYSADAGRCWQPQGPWIRAVGHRECPQSTDGLTRLSSAPTAHQLLDRLVSVVLPTAIAAESKSPDVTKPKTTQTSIVEPSSSPATKVNSPVQKIAEELTFDEASDRIRKITADVLGIDAGKITNRVEFKTDLGASEFDMVELVLAWEESFGVRIPDQQALGIRTVNDAIESVMNLLSNPAPVKARSEPVQKTKPTATTITLGQVEFSKLSGPPKNLSKIAFIDAESGLVIADDRSVLMTGNGGKEWAILQNPDRTQQSLTPLIVKGAQAMRVDTQGNIYLSLDSGQSWDSLKRPHEGSPFYDLPDRTIVTIDNNGNLVGATGEKEQWAPFLLVKGEDQAVAGSEYSVRPAYWYYLLILFCVALILVAVWPRIEQAEDDGIAGLAASDKPLQPGDPDALNLGAIAADITTFLSNPKTTAPLTMAITGPWGSGKSSLMNLVRADLEQRGFSPVWFNAWHHQKGEQLLASLFAHIKQQAIPSWFSFDGVWFRLKLAFIRSYRHWFVFAVLLGLLFFTLSLNKAEVLGFFTHMSKLSDPDSWWHIPWENWMPNLQSFFQSGDWIQTLAGIFGIGTPLVALLRSIRGFGINPSKLVSIDHSRDGKKGYDPGARARFAKEFNDVTRALGNNKMVIFIDDLDRCSQDNLIDILENINFISSSGDCFMLLGMAPKYIEACVANAYETLAQSIAEKEQYEELEHIDDEKTHKFRFAHNYLEKMINIEVAVPQMQGNSSIDQLFNLQSPQQNKTSWNDRLQTVMQWSNQSARIALPVLIILMAIGYGWEYGRKIPDKPRPVPPEVFELGPVDSQTLLTLSQVRTQPLTAQLTATQASPHKKTEINTGFSLAIQADKQRLLEGIAITSLGKGEMKADLLLKLNTDTVDADIVQQDTVQVEADTTADKSKTSAQKQPAEFRQATFESGGRISPWNLLLGLLLFGSFSYYLYKKKRDKYASDSDDFKAALFTWTPWIQAKQETPRGVKRFLNHLRFLAVRNNRDLKESVLVAMATIYFYKPEWLLDEAKFKALCELQSMDLLTEEYQLEKQDKAQYEKLKIAISDLAERLNAVVKQVNTTRLIENRDRAVNILSGALPVTRAKQETEQAVQAEAS